MVQAQRMTAGWGMSIIAGIAAGVVGALVNLGLEFGTGSPFPPHTATAWSTLAAGLLGGLLYGVLTRITRRPVAALWIITLLLATIDSLLVITQPFPEGSLTIAGLPIYGLVVPLKQAAALVGLGHFGQRHAPQAYLFIDTVIHYVTAVAVSLVVPWIAKPLRTA